VVFKDIKIAPLPEGSGAMVRRIFLSNEKVLMINITAVLL
jgi:hypothetical protein